MWLEIVGSLGVGVVVLAVLIRKRIERKFGQHNVTQEIDVKGKVVLITGGNSGLGKEFALEIAKRGAVVIIASRDLTLSKRVAEEAKLKNPNANIVPMNLDLGSLDSIRQFVKEFQQKYNHINILVNCAGVASPLEKGKKTKDGFEFNFGINHLGHFLLTNLLLDALKRGAPSRILVVASTLSESAQIYFDDLMLNNHKPSPGRMSMMFAYSHSKLANILFAQELSRRLEGTGVNTYALCPGWVKTELGRYMDLRWWNYILMIPAQFMFMRTTHQGVQTILHCALSKKVESESGKLYRNCENWDTKSDLSEDKAKKLWEESETLLKL